eukprot:1929797-Prymnesium_polylepis.1
MECQRSQCDSRTALSRQAPARSTTTSFAGASCKWGRRLGPSTNGRSPGACEAGHTASSSAHHCSA